MFWERLGGLDEFKELLLPIQNPATLAGHRRKYFRVVFQYANQFTLIFTTHF
jgi:hypothetical protein